MTTYLKSKTRKQTSPRGFTLVELLVTIVVISILAGITLTAMGTAREGARVRKTRATIATLHDLLMERYESYRYRRVPIDTTGYSGPAADFRLEAIRELMKLELPDRWSDVTLDAIDDDETSVSAPASNSFQSLLTDRTALSEAYLRRFRSLRDSSGNPPTGDTLRTNQGAECLYLIITMATADGEARSFFGDNEIGDVDNDGASEFLDAWGKPISFIRWPAGFYSPLQPAYSGGAKLHAQAIVSSVTGAVAKKLAGINVIDGGEGYTETEVPSATAVGFPGRGAVLTAIVSSDGSVTSVTIDEAGGGYPNTPNAVSVVFGRDAGRDHDPFDIMKRHEGAYRITPLIYSTGPDGGFDISVSSVLQMGIDPYVPPGIPPTTKPLLGTQRDGNSDGEEWHDNIHNHLIGVR